MDRRVLSALTVALLAATLPIVAHPVGAAATPTCAGRPATIIGTDGPDRIEGTPRSDVIVGGGGNDRIRGGGGDDVICGGPGRDALSGGAGNDLVNGGSGPDRVAGNVGDDIVLGGAGRDELRAGTGVDRLGGGRGHDTCTAAEIVRLCEAGAGVIADPPAAPIVERVIHVSVDGLRADAVTPTAMPNLSMLIGRSASTRNARTDPDRTNTLPNHTAQVTGRPVGGPDGHGVTYNDDEGRTVHDDAGSYVASVFDVVHDHGGRTGAWVGKTKFDLLDRSWDGEHGAPDVTGADDGRDKIDVYERADPVVAVESFLAELARADLTYSFVHVRSPDEFGHEFGWDTAGYADGLAEADEVIGRIIDTIDAESAWARTTAIIVVSDHGGTSGSTSHGDVEDAENYTIPFIVWAPGVAAGADLYDLNGATRTDPGESRPGLEGLQPIRGHDVANLALWLLDLPPVPGSVFNADQSVRIG